VSSATFNRSGIHISDWDEIVVLFAGDHPSGLDAPG
jgi:hypothetical protein